VTDAARQARIASLSDTFIGQSAALESELGQGDGIDWGIVEDLAEQLADYLTDLSKLAGEEAESQG
jgi:hypothetical protein